MGKSVDFLSKQARFEMSAPTENIPQGVRHRTPRLFPIILDLDNFVNTLPDKLFAL